MADQESFGNASAPPSVRVIPPPAIDRRGERAPPSETGERGRWIVFLAFFTAVLILTLGDTRSPQSSPATVPTSTPAPPIAIDDSWKSSTPEEQGIASGKLADLVERAAATGWIDSVTVVRNGTVVLDTAIFPFSQDVGHDVGPSTTSVVGTLVGIAIDRGLLPGVDVPVVEILTDGSPEIVAGVPASVTVEHLLTMSSGLPCGETDGYLQSMMQRAPGAAARHPLDLPLSGEPGARFEYCGRSFLLLATVLSEVAGKPVADFAAEVLFEPLGITDFSWPTSRDGISVGGGKLVLTPADLAKIGHLYLRAGEWDGEQVVSPEWVQTATAPHIETADSVFSQYGYGWYIHSGFVMSNRGDQSIVIVPQLDLVVVFTSGLPPTRNYIPEELTAQYLLAAIKPEPPPADPDAQARLAATVAAARSGPEPVGAQMPDIASAVECVRYDFRANNHGHEWFRISFDTDTATLAYQGGPNGPAALFAPEGIDEPVEIEVGLQGRFLVDETQQPTSAWRGEWQGDNALLIEYRIIGEARRGTFRFTFEDNTAHLQVRNTTSGTVHESIADRAEV